VKTKPTTLVTKPDLIRDLKAMGICPGMVLEVHTSLKAIGFVVGGERTVVEALMELLTSEGTLMMPTHSGGFSHPENWLAPPVPREWWSRICEQMPLFDPALTPLRRMGKVPEMFLHYPGVLRSYHPTDSCAAWGKHSAFVVENHSLGDPEGPQSPVGKIYELGGSVLTVGVGLDRATALHLAECLADLPTLHMVSCKVPVLNEQGEKVFIPLDRCCECSAGFSKAEPLLFAHGLLKEGRVGAAPSLLLSVRPAIDLLVERLRKDSTFFLCEEPDCPQCREFERRRGR